MRRGAKKPAAVRLRTAASDKTLQNERKHITCLTVPIDIRPYDNSTVRTPGEREQRFLLFALLLCARAAKEGWRAGYL
jgi:hypothetical protein